ncbi:hypothetical protein [Candidatus Marithrix sp. Canyon 246]|uniref:hypothetical protein n=1 Tax=Candidatus Marithrix sp. Canyon 246 TaxID=1827136 RepID=UPI00084A16C6|nr:hypothetical protein [Candidatus Marithrix sp. Canyon 246]
MIKAIGHVDGVGAINATKHSRSKYIAAKGSICVDGISLTVNSVQDAEFTLNIVPHTQENTTLADIKIGQRVNLEVDIIARYLERLLVGKQGDDSIDASFLKEHEFM